MPEVKYHGKPIYDQDDESAPIGGGWPEPSQTAKWWAARAYELEDALIQMYLHEDRGNTALEAVQRFERTVAGGDDGES